MSDGKTYIEVEVDDDRHGHDDDDGHDGNGLTDRLAKPQQPAPAEYQADTTKTRIVGEIRQGDVTITYGGVMMRGWRDYMEDRMGFHQEGGYIVFAIFDGHNGDGAAQHCGELFPKFLCRNLCQLGASKDSIVTSFQQFEATVPDDSGCTATVCVIDVEHKMIHTAHIGDSRALAFTLHKQLVHVTRDHNPSDPIERDRLINMAGMPDRDQNNMRLSWDFSSFSLLDDRMINNQFDDANLCRSFGDGNFREVGREEENQPMTCIPEYHCLPFDQAVKDGVDRLDNAEHTLGMVLCSDGIWNSCFKMAENAPPPPAYIHEDDSHAFSQFLVDFFGGGQKGTDEARRVLESGLQDRSLMFPYVALYTARKVFNKCRDERAESSRRGGDINADVVDFLVEKLLKPSTKLKVEEKGRYVEGMEEGCPVVAGTPSQSHTRKSLLKSPTSPPPQSAKSARFSTDVHWVFPLSAREGKENAEGGGESLDGHAREETAATRYADLMAALLDKLIATDDADPMGRSTDNMSGILFTISWGSENWKVPEDSGRGFNSPKPTYSVDNSNAGSASKPFTSSGPRRPGTSLKDSLNQILDFSNIDEQIRLLREDTTKKAEGLQSLRGLLGRLHTEKEALTKRQNEMKAALTQQSHAYTDQVRLRKELLELSTRLLQQKKAHSKV